MTCEIGGCRFLPLCESCEQAEIVAATKHLSDQSVYSPLASRWGEAGLLPPPEIEAYVEQVLADVGGSSSSLTPGAGDATQGAKDAEPGTASDSPPPTCRDFATYQDGHQATRRNPVMPSVKTLWKWRLAAWRIVLMRRLRGGRL